MDSFPYKGRLPSTYPACLFPNIFAVISLRLSFQGGPLFRFWPFECPTRERERAKQLGAPRREFAPPKSVLPKCFEKNRRRKNFPREKPRFFEGRIPPIFPSLIQEGLGVRRKSENSTVPTADGWAGEPCVKH